MICDRQTDGQMDGRTDGQTQGEKQYVSQPFGGRHNNDNLNFFLVLQYNNLQFGNLEREC